MVDDAFLTMHPEGKRGWNISRAKYSVVKASILACLERRQLTFADLAKCVSDRLEGKFEGSTQWYVEVVKLDLEARGTIKRMMKARQQLYRLR